MFSTSFSDLAREFHESALTYPGLQVRWIEMPTDKPYWDTCPSHPSAPAVRIDEVDGEPIGRGIVTRIRACYYGDKKSLARFEAIARKAGQLIAERQKLPIPEVDLENVDAAIVYAWVAFLIDWADRNKSGYSSIHRMVWDATGRVISMREWRLFHRSPEMRLCFDFATVHSQSPSWYVDVKDVMQLSETVCEALANDEGRGKMAPPRVAQVPKPPEVVQLPRLSKQKKRPGNPGADKTTRTKEERVFRQWKEASASGTKQIEFSRAIGLPLKELQELVDRVRKRIEKHSEQVGRQ